MEIFQKSVVKKYLQSLDDIKVNNAYKKFLKFYGNKARIQNITQLKEENYQEGFLREIFVQVLGYTINPDENYNLTTEYKNFTDAKKADAAILKNNTAIGVIELKSTKTKDLDKIKKQAFNYKNNQPDCKYVITSNFRLLRFYIDNATEFEEFDLFNLTEIEFKKLFLITSKESIFTDIPAKLKQETQFHEEKITDKFYKDYSTFKRKIFNNLIKNNKQYDQLVLFKKSQKLLDRILFVFFAEDRGLVPPNSISRIIEQWHQLKDLEAYQPLYDRFKLFFSHLNTGHKYTSYELPPYNGGLFANDDILDNVIIDDDILKEDSLVLSAYDFSTEIDVNILGHIFEHSLNEIEEITAELEGITTDKKKTKRKKEGIFYTPKYITQYIIENTVGVLCNEKKKELEIFDIGIDESHRKADGKISKKGEQLYKKLNRYKECLLTLKILDPACGSGAFLNQALEFLIEEHKINDSLINELTNQPLGLFDTDKAIIENNLYGVDLNEESVEIAKLSLWLRTARKGRKLSMLNNNIKCGNSLIDDPEIAGDEAFNWGIEFPEIMDNGGFDVVIGNPPYVRQEIIKRYTVYLLGNYHSYSGKADLYVYFYEKALNLLKKDGMLSFISSGKFFQANYGKALIKHLLNNSQLLEIIDFYDLSVFNGISAYPLILSCVKRKVKSDYSFNYNYIPNLIKNAIDQTLANLPENEISIYDFKDNDFTFIDKPTALLIQKINKNSITLKDLKLLPLVGIKTGFNEGFIRNKKISKYIKPYLFGKNLKRYTYPIVKSNIVFPYYRLNDEYCLLKENSEIINLLIDQKEQLEKRAIINTGILNSTKKWYEYQQINKKIDFNHEYIVYPNVSLGCQFTLSKNAIIDMTGFIIPTNDKTILAILNSKLVQFLMKIYAITRRGGYQEFKVQYVEKIPIKQFNNENTLIINDYVKQIFELNSKIQNLKENFEKYIFIKFKVVMCGIDFVEDNGSKFLSFLKKNKIKINISDESELYNFFEEKKNNIILHQNKINLLDYKINETVFKLYDLTNEEIEIVENSL